MKDNMTYLIASLAVFWALQLLKHVLAGVHTEEGPIVLAAYVKALLLLPMAALLFWSASGEAPRAHELLLVCAVASLIHKTWRVLATASIALMASSVRRR